MINEYKKLASCETEIFGSRSEPFPEREGAVDSLNIWPKIRQIIISRDNHRCRRCHASVEGRASWLVEVHHIIPRVEGGSHHPANLETLCAECHRHLTQALVVSRMPKSDSEWDEWHLNRKFRQGRDFLKKLMDEP